MTSPARVRRQQQAARRMRERVPVHFSVHARARMQELGFHETEVLQCVAAPEQTYAGDPAHPPGRRIYQRHDCAVVVDDSTRTVVTVLLRTTSWWQHGLHTHRTHP
jgi:hypothetical protein